MSTTTSWIDEKKREVLAAPLSLEEVTVSLITDREMKRKHYHCGPKNYLQVGAIPVWKESKYFDEKAPNVHLSQDPLNKRKQEIICNKVYSNQSELISIAIIVDRN